MLVLPRGIVWLASFPKSGNTWMRILLSNLMAGGREAEDINRLALADGVASSRGLFEAATLVDSRLLTADEIDRMRPAIYEADAAEREGAGLVKAHDAYTRLPDGTPLLGRAARAAVYMVRDPRDVAVSLAFHIDDDPDDAIGYLNRPDSTFGASNRQVRQWLNGWSGHVTSWLDQTDIPVHVVRYEDLQADTTGVLRRTLDFLGATCDDDTLAAAVRFASFVELQRQERLSGFAERTSRTTPFFRTGVVGDWRRHLDRGQVARIEAAHADVMARLGYPLGAG